MQPFSETTGARNKMTSRTYFKLFATLAFATVVGAATAQAQLVSQYGILDLTANGGINPNTGFAWQAGDQYRLAFYTADKISAESDDPAVYDDFATAQAQQNPALASSTGWTAMVWVNTDDTLPQAVDFNFIIEGVESPISSPLVRGGYDDTTGGAGAFGAGVPVYAMNGTTAIARNNADILNNWSNPFDGDTTLRLASGSTNLDSNGNSVVAAQNVNYSPFLNQFGLGDTATVHGTDTWTGGLANPVNPLGNSIDPDTQTRGSWGSSNANTGGRVWNRFQSGTTATLSVYAISPLLTVMEDMGSFILGDTNNDGTVDTLDIDPFVLLLTDPAGYATAFPGVDSLAVGDINMDDVVDTLDIDPFVALLTAGSLTGGAVPEPGSIVLLGLAGVAGFGLAVRRR